MSDWKMAGPLPFLLNLGQPEEVIGWTTVYRAEDGKVTMTVDFGPEGSRLLDHFSEIVDLKAIGFAGIVKEGMDEQARALHSRGPRGPGR